MDLIVSHTLNYMRIKKEYKDGNRDYRCQHEDAKYGMYIFEY